jgi:hypothetical protein
VEEQSYVEPYFFFRLFGDELVLILFHVDDAVVVGEEKAVSDAISRLLLINSR